MPEVFTPGEPVQESGIYEQVLLERHCATCTKGEPFPPTLAPGLVWQLVESARDVEAGVALESDAKGG